MYTPQITAVSIHLRCRIIQGSASLFGACHPGEGGIPESKTAGKQQLIYFFTAYK